MAQTYVVATCDTLGKIGPVRTTHGKPLYVPGLRATVMA